MPLKQFNEVHFSNIHIYKDVWIIDDGIIDIQTQLRSLLVHVTENDGSKSTISYLFQHRIIFDNERVIFWKYKLRPVDWLKAEQLEIPQVLLAPVNPLDFRWEPLKSKR